MDLFRHREDRVGLEAVGSSGVVRPVDDFQAQTKRLISVECESDCPPSLCCKLM
jgi:hypothetical protein